MIAEISNLEDGSLVFEGEPNLEITIAQLLKYVGEYYNADCVCILEFDWKNNVINNTYKWCAEGIVNEIKNLNNNSIMATPLYRGSAMSGLIKVDNPRSYVKELSFLNLCSYLAMDCLNKNVAYDGFKVYYQPQVELKTNHIIGAEALIRKIDDDGRVILPNEFIPYYEAKGIIRNIDFFVLETVCKDIKRWEASGLQPRISVNFSRATLMEADIVRKIVEVCKIYDVDPSAITIEVTESLEKMNGEELHILIAELSKAGFETSLDDFGSKYSNLSLLTEMYFDEIKLDKSLTAGVENNRRNQIVVKNISNMCRELGEMRLLAEGIETEEQKERLHYYQYEYGQGYYFYRPMKQEIFEEVLKQNML